MPALAIGHRRDRTASDDGSDDPPRAVIRELRIRYECSRKGFVLRSLGEIGSVRYTEHMKLARRLLTDTTQEKTYMTFDEIANSTAVLGELQQFYTVGETRERLRQQLPICVESIDGRQYSWIPHLDNVLSLEIFLRTREKRGVQPRKSFKVA